METNQKQPPLLSTPAKAERDARDMALYREYERLCSVPGQSRVAAAALLMKKYKIHSTSTFHAIRKRVEARLNLQNENENETEQ